MAKITKQLTVPRFASVMNLLFFTVTYVVVTTSIVFADALRRGFDVVLVPMTAVSVSFATLSLPLLSIVKSIVSRAERAGVKVNEKLVKDYRNGCFTISSLATLGVALSTAYYLTREMPVAVAAISSFATLVVVLLMLLLGMHTALKLLAKLE